MKTKEKILKMLQENAGTFVSGQDIGEKLFLSRAGIWKAINTLREDGYEIDAVTNRGYRLRQELDSINPSKISKSISQSVPDFPVFYFDEVESTNDECEKYAREHHNNCVIIANHQTKGRGRRGREFYSPNSTGLYFSILIFVDKEMARVTDFTSYAAVATANAIDGVLPENSEKTQIKWVNDVFLKGKKVAGILAEAHTSLEEDESMHVIIGIGVNVFNPVDDFPEEIKNVAGAVISSGNCEKKDDLRNEIVSQIVKNIFRFYNGGTQEHAECLRQYREKSFLIGSYIKINNFSSSNPEKRYALVTGISDDYKLLVKYEDGTQGSLSSGEVSVVKY